MAKVLILSVEEKFCSSNSNMLAWYSPGALLRV